MTERDYTAEMRGHCIHNVRMTLGERGRTPNPRRIDRIRWRMCVSMEATRLRELGPGAVLMPETCAGPVLGEPTDWWGCDTCDGSGERERNVNGADVPTFCGFCVRGVAGERRMMRRHGWGEPYRKTVTA